MTTEVLRNMLYADSDLLQGLGFVVMDEVHYLADRLRGPVWEEVIIHLDRSVQLVSLSATVSNAEEFGAWLQEVRGSTEIIVSETRPVPAVAARDRRGRAAGPVRRRRGRGGGLPRSWRPRRPARETPRSTGSPPSRSRWTSARAGRAGKGLPRPTGHQRPPPAPAAPASTGPRTSERDAGEGMTSPVSPATTAAGGAGGALRPARRPEVVELLDDAALLPAIMFIFSRAG